MVGPPGVGVVAPRIGAGLDGDELIPAIRIGEDPAFALEVGVERRIMRVTRMVVAAGGVGLPDFDHGVGHGVAIFVGHSPTHDDAFTHAAG